MISMIAQPVDEVDVLQTQPSLLNKQWEFYDADERYVQTIIQRYDYHDIVARILSHKNIPLDGVPAFLSPRLRDYIPEPFVLLDMEKSAQRTADAIEKQEKIVIYADFDVDGATSSALLRRYLRDIGYNRADVYIPDRLTEGYGAHTEALLSLREKGADLILMTDCGTTAFDPLEQADAAGLDVIVLDHHNADTALPKAYAIVNPNRLDQTLDVPEMRYLCAAGVSYLFVIALNRLLRQRGFFNTSQPEPNLLEYLDLVALGTVCDVMPLVGLNRAFVKQGLKVMAKRQNMGLTQLTDSAQLKTKPSTYHLGFMIGPRINAGGRVGQARLGSDVLTSTDPIDIRIMVQRLNSYNSERQAIEKYVLQEALNQIETHRLDQNPLIVVAGDHWHPGVIGIVASRLKEKYHKPACVIAFDEHDGGKGSGRSVPQVKLGEAMIKATQLGLLEKGGGHAMAAGFSLTRSQLGAFTDYLMAELGPHALSYAPKLTITSALSLSAMTPHLVACLEALEPFGMGNPKPLFLLKSVTLTAIRPLSEGVHCRLSVVDSAGHQGTVMAFGLGHLFHSHHQGTVYDMVVSLKNDQGKMTLIVEDMKLI